MVIFLKMIQKMRQCLAARQGRETEGVGCAAVRGVLPPEEKASQRICYTILWINKIVSYNSMLIRRYKCKTRSKVVQQFSWMKGLLLVLLVSMVSCLTTYSYPYFTSSLGIDIAPLVPISNLTVGDTVTIEYNFFHQTGYNPTTFTAQVGNSAGFPISPNFPNLGGANRAITFNTPMTYSFTAALTDYVVYTGTSDFILSLQMFYLTITKNGATVLTKHVDIVRGNAAFKVIYLNATKDITIDCTASTYLFPMATDPANFKFDSLISFSNSTNTARTYASLAAGYYVLQFDATSAGTLSYQSDPYPCPYDAATYSDPYKSFQACTTSTSSSSSSQPPSEGLVAWQIAVIVVGVVLGVVLIVIVVLLLAKSSAASASTAGTVVPDSSGIVESVKQSNIAGIGMPVK